MRVLFVFPDLSSTVTHHTGAPSYGVASLAAAGLPAVDFTRVGENLVRRSPALDRRLGGHDRGGPPPDRAWGEAG